MNNTALEKITEQITISLIVSLLPFIWFFTYLLRGGYVTTPIYSVLIVSGVLFLDLTMLLFSYRVLSAMTALALADVLLLQSRMGHGL